MARKQEKLATTAEVKDPAPSVQGNALQPEGGSLSALTDSPTVLTAGEGVAPATDSGLAKSDGQEVLAGQAGSSLETGAAATSQAGDTNAPATGADNIEGADQAALAASDGGGDSGQPVGEVDLATNPNPVTVQIYPLRSYMDEGELRRRGGSAYSVPRRHAEELVQRKLASLEPLKE
ncbi:hypothetical protein [Pseudomonas monteilii]|uniref:hypothetical protein n=1 Tax=Pseudomonas monteilii TaxID=76759 RepID=UPI001E49FB09|nr:hypothetical protein [Pseudomonas monteilii]WJO30983.1 hypothetical protein LU690_18075 [Pseudomonas monteilii]